MRKTYPTDLSDEEWAYLKNRLPASKLPGRLRAHSLRDVFDAIFYVLRSGCPWRFLPSDFPPWSTVYYHFRKFRMSGLWHRIFMVLHAAERKRVGKDPDASAAIMDSQSAKTTEEGAATNGYDAHKNVKGRKRHLLVDTLGLPLSVYVTPADVQDRAGARLLLAGLEPLVPNLKKIWADGAYGGEKLAKWCEEQGGWELEVVERDKEAKGFKVLAKRWIVERTFGWLGRNRRLAKDYERKVQTSETLIKVAMIRLMLRRLARAA
ncbi:MAG: IS5 family transposase [Actinomycetota bacterium]|nr:IS5 family transposase [Actinomycetota bacterium]